MGAGLHRGRWLAGLAARLGNPLDWSRTDKTLLVLGLTLVFNPLLLASLALLAGFEALAVLAANWFQVAFSAVFSLFFVAGLALRRKRPRAEWLTYPAIVAISAHSAWFVCGAGYATSPISYLLFFVDVFVGMLLFDYAVGLVVFAAWVAVIGLHVGLEAAGLLAYAPFLQQMPAEVLSTGGPWDTSQAMNGFIIVVSCLVLCGWMIDRWRKRERQVVEMSELLKRMFGRYLSTEVMNSLLENPAALELGGERRTVTILMSDLRGFTALSERLEPEQVVSLLNAYFEVMVEVILKYDGTISEIIGDALLVVFGAPQAMQDRTLRCVACAIEMQNAMAEVNRRNRSLHVPEIEMGIGVNETEAVVGNIGSSKRSNYTVVGRGVNMAQRIESYSVGGQVLISESVRRAAGSALRVDGRRQVFPKGAEAPFTIHEVGGVGAPFNVTLLAEEAGLQQLARPIPALVAPLDGKHVGRQREACCLIRLSRKAADLSCDTELEPYANVKLNLDKVSEELQGRDFYAKVIRQVEGEPAMYHVRFTALPSEIDGAFQAALIQSRISES